MESRFCLYFNEFCRFEWIIPCCNLINRASVFAKSSPLKFIDTILPSGLIRKLDPLNKQNADIPYQNNLHQFRIF
jgi:hypothetical protein